MKAVVELAVQTLGPVLYVLLLAGAALGLVVGVMLLVDSARVMRWNYALNKWYSTRKAMQALERPVEVKRFVYRWHRVLGALVFAGSLYTLDILVFGFNTNALVRIFRDLGNPAILGLVVETVRIFLIVGNIAALLAAAVLVFRPSLLKGLEAWGDRYYSSREATEALDLMRYQPDEFVQARPRMVGALVTLGSLYVLLTLGMLLLR
jgi:hypothetical protein